ncbi:hypothetical protein QP849_04830 [Alloscardovia omnicolens]|uniref:hypothetical protein n=1 Tax=Alloscardovia omnicolens TaxID=419015 RepID=UPI00254A2928|nr:hypothetical protein [Alloscardovia omnicolens]MDK8649728.1 hypothetical protein [Alloscardovia omnicolens]
MVMVDPDAMYWMKNQSWWAEDENGEYILTDEATEKARKSFERFQYFSEVTCLDEGLGEDSPAFKAYRDYVLRETGEDLFDE